MMFNKKYISIILIIIFIASTTIVFGDIGKDNVSLIVYENNNEFGYLENKANHIKQLLFKFSAEVDIIEIDKYKSKDIEKYDYVVVTNIMQDIDNKNFLEDLSNYNKKIYWIGDKIENYLDYSKKYTITYKESNNNIIKINYKNNNIPVKGENFYNIVSNSENVEVLSTMSDGYNTYPYIVRENNLFYISRYHIGDNFIFEDSLNDFYNITSYKEGEIFVRIEDVHPFRDTKELREIADYLYSRNVPFMIALIPTYVDNKTGHINTIESKPEFIDTIKYMQEKGGSVILHGYTHQIGTEEVSGEGYEFWDIKNDKPIENIDSYVKDRVLSGLRLCIENGIYPLGFEAPHYAMDSNGYKELKKYFSTYVGQYQNNDDSFATSTFPYIIKDSNLFNTFIPENMGYIDEESMFSIEEIKGNYQKLNIVRGYTGGFFYHPYLDINYLKNIIEFLQDNNAKFFDLKSNYNYVEVDDIKITSNSGKITCNYDESKVISKKAKDARQYSIFRSINDVVISFVIIVLIIFLIIFIVFRKINKGKFTRR